MAVNRLESTEKKRGSLAHIIEKKHQAFSLENDKVQEYMNKIPDLSPREMLEIKFILDSSIHE